MKPEQYSKLLKENITKTYKKASNDTLKEINNEAKQIAINEKLDDRIECFAKRQAFITLKDNKDNFRSSLPCRLLNPVKSELGKISKTVLENISSKFRGITELNQWKNSMAVIEWFKNTKNKD